MLSLEFCRQRQQRLLARMAVEKLDFVLLTSARLIYYLSGALVDSNWPQCFALASDGRSALVSNAAPTQCAASEVQTYTGYTTERFFDRSTMQEELVAALDIFFGLHKRRVGLEAESAPIALMPLSSESSVNVTPWLAEMRRRKDPDEIESMRATIALTEAGYAAAREKCAPGMTEYQVYSIINNAIVAAAGTAVDLKGDFACGIRAINGGGPPTSKLIEEGELYILDLFPVFEGYKCDLCRTFCIGQPTADQREIESHVLAAHELAKQFLRPGFPVRAAYERTRTFLDELPLTKGSFMHHAGHGVGMEGWERPWLNAGTDGVFLEDEVIAFEPGLYSPALRGGIRLEHNYLITANGPVALDSFPMGI